MPCAGVGQASFALSNYSPGDGVDAPVYDALGNPLAGGAYQVELWGGATSNSLSPLLVLFDGGRREIRPFMTDGYFQWYETSLSVTTVPPDGYAWLELRAWDASLGGTYEEVEALGIGGYGESPLFYAEGSDPFAEPPRLPAPLIGLQSFSLRPIVPEPSTFALAGAGAVTLLVIRRRC